MTKLYIKRNPNELFDIVQNKMCYDFPAMIDLEDFLRRFIGSRIKHNFVGLSFDQRFRTYVGEFVRDDIERAYTNYAAEFYGVSFDRVKLLLELVD